MRAPPPGDGGEAGHAAGNFGVLAQRDSWHTRQWHFTRMVSARLLFRCAGRVPRRSATALGGARPAAGPGLTLLIADRRHWRLETEPLEGCREDVIAARAGATGRPDRSSVRDLQTAARRGARAAPASSSAIFTSFATSPSSTASSGRHAARETSFACCGTAGACGSRLASTSTTSGPGRLAQPRPALQEKRRLYGKHPDIRRNVHD
jgi:hypothetical protein